MSDRLSKLRRQYRGTLNDIPLSIAYAFELRIIIENKREDGMRGSMARIEGARMELNRRAKHGDENAKKQLARIG